MRKAIDNRRRELNIYQPVIPDQSNRAPGQRLLAPDGRDPELQREFERWRERARRMHEREDEGNSNNKSQF